MGTITISVDDKTEDVFRKVAASVYGTGKGHLGKALTEAIQKWVHERQQKKIGKEMSEMMHKGFDMGKIMYKTRDELWVREK